MSKLWKRYWDQWNLCMFGSYFWPLKGNARGEIQALIMKTPIQFLLRYYYCVFKLIQMLFSIYSNFCQYRQIF
jgi:hypothetical protein